MRNFLRHRNKGFTLVELIVTIAIITIVGGIITSFLLVSQRQYNNGVAETSVQYDAQLVGNQIHDLLIDAQRGVSYGYVSELADGTTESGLIMDSSTLGDYRSLELYVYNYDKYYRMRWDKDAKTLYFAEAAPGVTITNSMEALLAEFVTDFSVDLSELLAKKTIRYSITFRKEESGREYTTNHTVKLRNDVLMNASEDEIYVPDPPLVEATGIDVYPESVAIWPGESEKLASRVTSNVGLMPSQEVAWFIAPLPSGESSITDTTTGFTEDVLYIGLNEEGKTIDGEQGRINVYAKSTAVANLQSDYVKVGIRSIRKLSTKAYQSEGNYGLGSSSNAQNGSYNISVVAGQEDICIDLEAFKGLHIGDLVMADMEETISNMGGITITVGGNYLLLDTTLEEAQKTGKIRFDVKNIIDFGEQSSVTAPVTIRCNRAPYTDVQETINVVITPKVVNDPIDVSKGWKRNGVLDIDLSEIRGAVGDGTVVDVHVRFYGINAAGEKQGFDALYTYGDQDRHDPDVDEEFPDYVVQHQEGTPCELLFNKENFNDVKLRLKAHEVSYSGAYYGYWGGFETISGAWIYITYGEYTSKVYDVAIEPVSMEYSLDGINLSSWDKEGDMTIYAAPVSEYNNYDMYNGYYYGAKDTSREYYKTYRTYYRLTGGWHVSSVKEEYTMKDDQFTCIIDGMAGVEIKTGDYSSEKFYFTKNGYSDAMQKDGYIEVASGEDSFGYYIDVKVPDSLNQYYAEKGSTMVVVYEGNRGSGLANEPDNFELMNGCEYGFKVKFVEDNLKEDYGVYELVRDSWLWWKEHWEYKTYTLSSLPSTQYCPAQSELKSQGYGNGTYFYISPQERYYIRTVTTGTKETYYITFEKYTSSIAGSGRWAGQWKDKNKYTIWFSYNQDDKEWQYSTMKF
ncbi:MAG: prepilin-type N-terminal cleavage/methylation domain-containing protein [Lachnospiraceae bacterium]|nr:prepilin-type N-terminal cleavage/methylation domain-containing protein [Lachnospiraceae bacterium]